MPRGKRLGKKNAPTTLEWAFKQTKSVLEAVDIDTATTVLMGLVQAHSERVRKETTDLAIGAFKRVVP